MDNVPYGNLKDSNTQNAEHVQVGTVHAKRVLAAGYDGSALQDLTVDEAGHLQIDVLTGGGGGTLVTDGAAASAASTGVLVVGLDGSNYQIIKTDPDGNVQTDILGGGVADDGTTPGNPLMIGGKAVETDGTDPTSVSAEDDVAIFRTDRNRRLLVNDVHPNLWSALISGTGSATATQVKAAPGANLSLYLTDLLISTNTAMTITVVESVSASAAKGGAYYLAANGGVAMPFQTPLRFSANTPIAYRASADGSYTILCNGYTAP